MFFIASRKRRGIEASASATCFSNRARCTGVLACRTPRLDLARAGDDVMVVVAVVADDALVAERRRRTDAPSMQDERVRRAGPALLRQRATQLLLDSHGVVAFGDADPVRDAEDVTVDGQARHAERMAEDDVRGLAADARQLDERVHAGRHRAAMLLD